MATIMTTTKSLIVAALLSTVAAVSFAQTPAAPATTQTAPTSPAKASASKATHKKLHHHKHVAKKTDTTAKATTGTKK